MSSAISPAHVAPADQPTSVSQITDRLFTAYTVDGGTVHLAGCLLEDRVFVRLGPDSAEQAEAEIYVDENGEEVDHDFVNALGMNQTIKLSTPARPLDPKIRRLIDAAADLFDRRFSGDTRLRQTSATVVWCKFAQGKLRFVVGDHAVELPFSDWARTLEPPPFVCPHSGSKTFHLAATDDGRIAAVDQIEICAQSGRRLLRDDLVTCSVSARRVAAELASVCPVSGDNLASDELVRCGTCREEVSPAVIQRNKCAACRQLQTVGKSDPRVARLLEKHPDLDRWRKWRLSETATVYILVASGWLKRLLVVADKESLDLKLQANSTRLSSGWNLVDPTEQVGQA